VPQITVGQVMSREIFAVAPETALQTAARLLGARHISGAPVVDAQGRPVGVIAQSDLCDPDRERSERRGISIFYRIADGARTAMGDEAVLSDGVVSDVMSPYVLAIGSRAPLLEAARLMVADEVHRLLVVDDGRLIGIVTSMDVLRAVVHLGGKSDGEP
jgi:CBS domain-containing membrane protein